MKHIVLTGMMGCGKSTCARLLGKKLRRNVVDTDDLVEQKAGMPISEIFAQSTPLKAMHTATAAMVIMAFFRRILPC